MADPLEESLAAELIAARIPFVRDDNASGLDFFLPEDGVYLELKRFHSPRIGGQMARVENVIAVQGAGALAFLITLLRCHGRAVDSVS